MSDLKIACLQFDQAWENRSENYRRINKFMESLEQVDILILPEMFDTGFTMNVSVAQEFLESDGLLFLMDLSKNTKASIITSMMTKQGNKNYNRGVFLRPDGSFECYDKRKLFTMAGENKVYEAGKQPTIIEFNGWKINLQICYDLRFPEVSRNSDKVGNLPYDLSIYMANWPQKRIHHWDALLKARSIENQSYVIGLNRVGQDENGIIYNGRSSCYDANGTLMWQAQDNNEELHLLTLNYEKQISFRTSMPFLKDT